MSPVTPIARSRSFLLLPFGRGAAGRVTITEQGSSFTVLVAVGGLLPGSAHAVHLHSGSCGAAFAGRHLAVLGTMTGTAAGFGTLARMVGFPYATGRYVIVYANLSPTTIIGCADLGIVF